MYQRHLKCHLDLPHHHQLNIEKLLVSTHIELLSKWLHEHNIVYAVKIEYASGVSICFEDENDLLAFKLKWF